MRFTEREEQRLISASSLAVVVGPRNLAMLKSLYQVEDRYYHTWDHALAVLKAVQQLELEGEARLAHEIAAVFHDCVYEVGAVDNEAHSSVVMSEMCNAREGVVSYARDLIMATALHSTSTRENILSEHWDFLDCDILSIAEPCWPIAIQNDWNVAAELVRKYPVDKVLRGRSDFLRGWLAKPSVFLGRRMGECNEWQARRNIARLIEVEHSPASFPQVASGL